RTDTAEALGRLDASGFDQELVSLVKECLRPAPEDRPLHAGAVAQRITQHLEAKTEEFSRGWLNLTTDGIWDWNLETSEGYLSPRFKKLLGYEDAELPNRADTWQRLVHPDDLPFALTAVKEHREEGRPLNLALRYRRKDGSTVWVLCRGIAVQNESGKVTRTMGTYSNITALKRAEEALAERVQLAEIGAHIGVALNRGGKIREILERCAGVLVYHRGVGLAQIWTRSRTGEFLELQASAGRLMPDPPGTRLAFAELDVIGKSRV